MTKYTQCSHCKKPVKYDKNNVPINFIALCNSCFNPENYTELIDVNEYNTRVYLNDKKLYFNKKEYKKYSDNEFKKNERKTKLVNKLKKMKLSYIKNGICDAYVNFGEPDIDTVIRTLLNKQNSENDRLCTLLNTLEKKNLQYDNTLPAYKKYVRVGGDLAKIIEIGELEKVLIKETNYLTVLDITDSDTARDISLSKINKKNSITDKYIKNKNTIKFD